MADMKKRLAISAVGGAATFFCVWIVLRLAHPQAYPHPGSFPTYAVLVESVLMGMINATVIFGVSCIMAKTD